MSNEIQPFLKDAEDKNIFNEYSPVIRQRHNPKIKRDLVQMVSDVLLRSDVPTDIIDEFNNDPHMRQLSTQDELTQRVYINRYWTYWFSAIENVDTRVYRSGLTMDGSIESWLRDFELISVPGLYKLGNSVLDKLDFPLSPQLALNLDDKYEQ